MDSIGIGNFAKRLVLTQSLQRDLYLFLRAATFSSYKMLCLSCDNLPTKLGGFPELPEQHKTDRREIRGKITRSYLTKARLLDARG